MDDRTLIHEVHKGRTELLNVIIEKYYPDIYRFCAYLTGNPQESYDLAQETFLKFIQYVDSYRYRNLKSYLLMIARNVCMDYSGDERLSCFHRRNCRKNRWRIKVFCLNSCRNCPRSSGRQLFFTIMMT